jgi:hypothetical protein
MRKKMMIYGQTIKEIIKEGWDVFPTWLWIANIALIVVSLLIIFLL